MLENGRTGSSMAKVSLPGQIGEFQNVRHGKGLMIWPSGDRYEGWYKDNREDGLGTFTWSTGDRYEGSWKQGKPHGLGVKTNADGTLFHEGQWKDGKPFLNKLVIFQFEEACCVSPDRRCVFVLFTLERSLTHFPLGHRVCRFAWKTMPLAIYSSRLDASMSFTSTV
jgi:hypothetical protein